MSIRRRVERLEEATGLRAPGCDVCRPWGNVHVVGERDAQPADGWGWAGGVCPRCGRCPLTVRYYAGIDVGAV